MREQCELSANKPNAGNILWSVPELRNVETKAAADELIVRGEIHLFAMYFPEDDDENIQYVEETLPFTGEAAACRSRMRDGCGCPRCPDTEAGSCKA